MNKALVLCVLCALFSCSESEQKQGLEVLEKWGNGVVKKDRVRLAADTFKVNYYHENFKLHMSGNAFYSEGEEVKNGEWKAFYPNGVNWSLNTFDKGVEDGDYRTWHRNGILNISGEYREGSATGRWTFYDGEGVVVKTFDATPQN